MTEKAAVVGGGLPCQHQRQLFHFASLCFASLHFYSRFHCRRSFVATNNTAGWFQLTALTPRPALCGFTFSENIQFSQKILTVLLVTQSHPLDLSRSDALVCQEEPCRGQILSLASKLKAAFPTTKTGAQLRVTLDSVSALCGGLAPTGVLVRTSSALQRAQATESSESTCLHQAAAPQTGFCSKFVTWLSRRFGSSGSIWIQCYPSSEG